MAANVVLNTITRANCTKLPPYKNAGDNSGVLVPLSTIRHTIDTTRSHMKVKVKATGQTGVVYGPVSGSGTSFAVLEIGNTITRPIATEWGMYHVSLDGSGMATFHPHELEEVNEDEELVRVKHERAEAEWQEFLQKTYGGRK